MAAHLILGFLGGAVAAKTVLRPRRRGGSPAPAVHLGGGVRAVAQIHRAGLGMAQGVLMRASITKEPRAPINVGVTWSNVTVDGGGSPIAWPYAVYVELLSSDGRFKDWAWDRPDGSAGSRIPGSRTDLVTIAAPDFPATWVVRVALYAAKSDAQGKPLSTAAGDLVAVVPVFTSDNVVKVTAPLVGPVAPRPATPGGLISRVEVSQWRR